MLREKSIRSENELIETLGAPLVAARPLVATSLAALLSEHWFSHRKALAVVSATPIAEAGWRNAAARRDRISTLGYFFFRLSM